MHGDCIRIPFCCCLRTQLFERRVDCYALFRYFSICFILYLFLYVIFLYSFSYNQCSSIKFPLIYFISFVIFLLLLYSHCNSLINLSDSEYCQEKNYMYINLFYHICRKDSSAQLFFYFLHFLHYGPMLTQLILFRPNILFIKILRLHFLSVFIHSSFLFMYVYAYAFVYVDLFFTDLWEGYVFDSYF